MVFFSKNVNEVRMISKIVEKAAISASSGVCAAVWTVYRDYSTSHASAVVFWIIVLEIIGIEFTVHFSIYGATNQIEGACGNLGNHLER